MEKQNQIILYVFVIASVLLVGFMLYHKSSPTPPPSTFVLTPSPILTPTKTPEPVITSWTTYKNDKYNFTIAFPDGWKQQEFTLPTGGFLVAFSPNALPCSSCTYIHEGYYSVKVYNQSTDPKLFADYSAAKQSLGKSKDVLPIHMGGLSGILYGNSAVVENHNWIYAVTLDNNNGTDSPLSSQLFQKAASSLQFTYLIFAK